MTDDGARRPPDDNDDLTGTYWAHWPHGPDLPGSTDPDEIPIEALPPVLASMARTISDVTQTPTDAAAIAVTGAVSIAIVGAVDVMIDAGKDYKKPAHEYGGIEMESGTGKSPLLTLVTRVIREWEKEYAEVVNPQRRLAAELLKLAEAQVRKAATPEELEIALRAEDEAKKVPHKPFQLLAHDSTEEALVRGVMAGNEGRAAIADSEATILELAAGRYSNDARLAALTYGWDGEGMRVNRVSSGMIDIPSVNLALLIGFQPGILRGLQHAETMKQKGIFNRFLLVSPTLDWNEIKTGPDVPLLDRTAVRKFENMIRTLLNRTHEGRHYTLTMSPEATSGIHRLHRLAVDAMKPGGALESVKGFAGKYPDHGARLAALFTMAHRVDEGQDPFQEPIPGWAVSSAIRVLQAISTHMVKILGPAAHADLFYLLRRIQAMQARRDFLTTSALLKDVLKGRRVRDKKELDELLQDMLERGCIRLVQAGTDRRPAGEPDHPATSLAGGAPCVGRLYRHLLAPRPWPGDFRHLLAPHPPPPRETPPLRGEI